MTYRIRGLDPAPFKPLFGLPDEELAERGIMRMTVDSPSFPCRVSLRTGQSARRCFCSTTSAMTWRTPIARHMPSSSLRARRRRPSIVDEVPPVFEKRILSLRGFDADGMMADAILTQPGEADEGIRRLFANPAVATIHAHNATRGCFAARIERN